MRAKILCVFWLTMVLAACQSAKIGDTITPYQCGRYQIDANYSQNTAVAHIDEDVYTLDNVPSGTGVKFENTTGRDEDSPIVIFWTKDKQVQLFLDENPGIVCVQVGSKR